MTDITFDGNPVVTPAQSAPTTSSPPANIVPMAESLIEYRSAIPLARYAQIIRTNECGFWGVNQDASPTDPCNKIWSKRDRDMIARYLSEAQVEIEDQINYLLQPTWIVGTPPTDSQYLSERYVDQREYHCATRTRWGYVIEPGIRASEDLSLGAAVSHAADPAVITINGVSIVDIDGVKVYHPGTSIQIVPSGITLSGSTLTIYIPRCRLLKESHQDYVGGWDYNDVAGFESTVDVVRVYNDPSTNAEYAYPHACTSDCYARRCCEYTHSACMYVLDHRLGLISTGIASYASGSWGKATGANWCRTGTPTTVRLNYLSGLKTLPLQAEDAIIRLAHSKMPEKPCSCPEGARLWERDREKPSFISFDREQCPFGILDGAWIAYLFARSMRLVRGGMAPVA